MDLMSKKNISQEELQKAVSKFIKNGGIIQKLPDQKHVLQKLVGGKWRNTEMGGEAG